MNLELTLKDLFLIISILSTIISLYYALKYKTKRNEEKNEETEGSFKSFKEFVYKELKIIEKTLTELLSKREAEDKYMTKIAHDLTMQNISIQLGNIVEKLDELKEKK